MENDRLGRWYARRRPWQKTAAAVAVFLAGFAVVALIHGSLFIKEHRYFIWGADGYCQHYPAASFIWQYLRQLLGQLLHGELRPPLYHFSLGLGGDIWNTLNYYGLGNPFYLLGLFARPEHEPLVFSLILEVQYLAGGLAFYALARKLGARRWGAVVGGWLYVFTGFFTMTLQHPIMAHAVVYLPLLLLGAERVMRRESPLLLGIVVLLMGVTGFYFAFISSVVLAFFILIRSWQHKQDARYWSVLWRNVLRAMLVYLAGLLASFAVFLPQVLAFLGSNRTGGGALPPLFGGLGALKQWLAEALLPETTAFVGALALLALLLALGRAAGREKGSGPLAVGAAIGAVLLLSPLAQSALVGFGDSQYTRFWYALALLFAMALALQADRLFLLTGWQLGAGVLLVLLGLLVLMPGGLEGSETPAVIFLGLTFSTVLLGQQRWWKTPGRACGVRRLAICLLAGLTVGQLAWGLCAQQAAMGKDAFRNERFVRLMPAVTAQTLPEGEYRVDVGEVADHQWWAGANAALVGGYKGMSEYFSILNSTYTNAMLHDWALAPAQEGSFSFQGLDGCAALNTLASVRYSFIRPGMEGYVPYGYTYVGDTPQAPGFTFVPDQNPDLKRYENQYTLPLAYGYAQCLPQQEYDQLNGLQRQAAMMQLAVLEQVPQGAAVGRLRLDGVQALAAQTRPEAGVRWEQGELSCGAKQEKGRLLLQFDAPPESELHLALRGMSCPPEQQGRWITVGLEGGTPRKLRLGDAVDPEESWVNLGYSEKGGPLTAWIELPGDMCIGLEELELWAYAMEDYAVDAQARLDRGLKNIVVGKNSIQALSESPEAQLVVFSVPWSSGWSAAVDGVPMPTIRANSMFIGVMVPAGSHSVRLYYTTPGLKAGVVCSGLGVLALAGLYLGWRLRRKKGPAPIPGGPSGGEKGR